MAESREEMIMEMIKRREQEVVEPKKKKK